MIVQNRGKTVCLNIVHATDSADSDKHFVGSCKQRRLWSRVARLLRGVWDYGCKSLKAWPRFDPGAETGSSNWTLQIVVTRRKRTVINLALPFNLFLKADTYLRIARDRYIRVRINWLAIEPWLGSFSLPEHHWSITFIRFRAVTTRRNVTKD